MPSVLGVPQVQEDDPHQGSGSDVPHWDGGSDVVGMAQEAASAAGLSHGPSNDAVHQHQSPLLRALSSISVTDAIEGKPTLEGERERDAPPSRGRGKSPALDA